MPNRPPSKLIELTRRLLAYEAASGKTTDAAKFQAFRVCEKLRGPLGKLMGMGGFRSLLSRALSLAGAELPWLRVLHINPDGSLGGMDDIDPKFDPHEFGEGEVVLVAHLIGLLVTFIGADLTQQLLRDIWPMMEDLNFEKRETP